MGISLSAGNWLTLAAVACYGAFQVIHGLVTTRRAGQVRGELLGQVEAVRLQVENAHPTNLRDDIDEIRVEIRTRLHDVHGDIRGLRQDIGSLRGEQREEREARAQLEHHVEKCLGAGFRSKRWCDTPGCTKHGDSS